MRLSEPRIQPAEFADLDEATRALLGFSQSKSGKQPDNVFTTFARNPDLFKHFIVFGSYILTGSTLPPRDREIVILRIGWLCQSAYEWGQHARIGRRCGLTEEEIRRITRGDQAEGWTELEAALLRAVDELHGDAFISDQTWKRLCVYYDTKQLIDLVFTVGQYNMVSMALNTFGVQLDERLSGFPKEEG
jgi:4-carboxymuconolactone decarboxylase